MLNCSRWVAQQYPVNRMLLRSFIAANSHRGQMLPNMTVDKQHNKIKCGQYRQSQLHQGRRAVCYSTAHDIYTNLATEQAFMRGVYLHKYDKLLMFYVNKPCLVIGRNQNVFSELALRDACDTHVDIARRGSGGGAVYHDAGNLCLSLFTHRTQYDPTWLMSFLTRALNSLLHVPLTSFTTTSRHDLFVDGKKITGSAMRVQRDIAMHHCTLLINSDLDNIGHLLRTNGQYVRFCSSSTSSVRSPVTSLNLISQELQQHKRQTMKCNSKENTMYCSETNKVNTIHEEWNVKDIRDYLASYFLQCRQQQQQYKVHCQQLSAIKCVQQYHQHKLRRGKDDAFNKITQLDLLYKSKRPYAYYTTASNNNNNNNSIVSSTFPYQNFKFIYADGRPPQRGDSTTFSNEIDKLQSCKWLLDMPPFTSTIAIAQKEIQSVMLQLLQRSLHLQSSWQQAKQQHKQLQLQVYNKRDKTQATSTFTCQQETTNIINSWLQKTLFVQHEKERQLCIDTTVDHGVITSISVTLTSLQHQQVQQNALFKSAMITNNNSSVSQNNGESSQRVVSVGSSNTVTWSNNFVHVVQQQQIKRKSTDNCADNINGDQVEWLTSFLTTLLVNTKIQQLRPLYQNVGRLTDLRNITDWILQGLEMQASKADVQLEINAYKFNDAQKTLFLRAFVSALLSC